MLIVQCKCYFALVKCAILISSFGFEAFYFGAEILYNLENNFITDIVFYSLIIRIFIIL